MTLIETMARAMFLDDEQDESSWENANGLAKQIYASNARAAIAAAEAAGWKLVPVEPTEAMMDAGLCGWQTAPADAYVGEVVARVYPAMLAAAPKADE